MNIISFKDYKSHITNESKIVVPTIENSFNFWHGGNLTEYNDVIAQKNGRYEYGPGLYLTNFYDIAKKYAKGSRKLYIVTVSIGKDIKGSYVDTDKVLGFIDEYVIKSMRKDITERVLKYEFYGFDMYQ